MKALSDIEVEGLNEVARQIRLAVVDILGTGGGHFGGSLSIVEILVTLYGAAMRVDPARPHWPDRDRMILSKGHAAAALYPVLSHYGFFERGLLTTYNKLDSLLGMHPDMHKVPGCDISTGSLGHGLALGIGMTLAGRADNRGYRVYVVMGDGECDEGSVWEAAMVASHHRLQSLTAIVDRNGFSIDGRTEDILALEPFAERWRSFGWHAVELDGHDVRQIHESLRQVEDIPSRPTVLICHTVKGKGIPFMEGKHQYHTATLSNQEIEMARAGLRRKDQ